MAQAAQVNGEAETVVAAAMLSDDGPVCLGEAVVTDQRVVGVGESQ